ncbi:MAG: winged helix-turn-helix transcriptional regulator [Thaumarchaeota archaeon]|nr:winged helix-turn-helix transcriptional regulator [Nitrososphaerota archaeon]
MPLALDRIDMAILRLLSENGRLSFRQVARQISVSTPTVESRVRKMTDAGIIRKFTLLLDSDKLDGGVAALLNIRVNLDRLDSAVSSLSLQDEVRSLFVTTGGSNLTVRVTLPNSRSLQEFLSSKIASLEGTTLVSSQIVTTVVKDEHGVAITGEMAVRLICDTCGAEIKGKPLTLNVGNSKRFFCCTSCLSIYKEKYRAGIEAVARRSSNKISH